MNISETLYYSFGGDTVGMRVDGELSWIFGDQFGSTGVTYKADGSGTVLQSYYPFGGIRNPGGAPVVDTDVGFTGQRVDETTGLMFYQARYYDPLTARFISADTMVPDPGNRQDFNRYSYVRNNPLRYTDPSGNTSLVSVFADLVRQVVEPPAVPGVTSGGVWTDAANAVIYFAGNEHTAELPNAEVLDSRVISMFAELLNRGYEVNVIWVVSGEMTRGFAGPGVQINWCNTPGVSCASLGDDFAAAIVGYADLTVGELNGFVHSHASLGVSIAFEQNNGLASLFTRLVFAAGTAIDSDGGTAMGEADVDVYVGEPAVLDVGSWGMSPSGPKLTSPLNIPGATMYDTFSARHSDHVNPSHRAFLEATRIIAGG